MYWQLLLAKETAPRSSPHSENHRQWSVNSFCCCIFGNHVIALIFTFITELLTAIIGKKYNIPKVKYRFQINLYCKLQSIQKHIIGCWKRHFNIIQLTNSKNKSLIWIYRWTRWATRWQPAQFRRVGSLPLNRTRVDGSVLLTTGTANLATVRFGAGLGPEVTVRNHC